MNEENALPTIAITMGDPVGVGPEIILKALADEEIRDYCKVLVVGDSGVLDIVKKKISSPPEIVEIRDPQNLESFSINKIPCWEPCDVDLRRLPFHEPRPDEECGRASGTYIKRAVELALLNVVQAIVTAPVSKIALDLAGFKYPGHTELLADLTQTREYAMMMAGPRFKVVLVTTHSKIKAVSRQITKARVLSKIRLAYDVMQKTYGIQNPRIVVAGLNPHAGETGKMGREEERSIRPAIEQARDDGINVEGPIPADTLFYHYFKDDSKYDISIAMYHDQGLIPFKMLHFHEGVNVTLGLPIIRTSPDHGTAFDIAGKDKANPSSMLAAIKMAIRMTGAGWDKK